MALAPLTLDDLTWTQMVDAARRRIVAASAGQWTLHAPVDPGVTLLELFAWLLEQRLYFADQVTPDLSRALLRLLDERPLPAVAAATVLQFATGKKVRRVGAGTVMQPVSARRASVMFSTDASMTLAPLGGPIALFARGETRSDELAVGAVDLTAPGAPMDVTITLPLAAPLPTGKWPPLGLLVELDSGPIAGQWAPGAATVPPPARIELWRQDLAGGIKPFPTSGLDDGTLGMRRSGVLRLPIDGWAPDPGTTSSYTIRLQCTQTQRFAFAPRLTGLWLNACVARHRRQVLPAPYHAQWLYLSDAPSLALAEGPAMTETVRLWLREASGAWMRWARVDDLASAGPGDRCFTADRDLGKIAFGDGLNGRLPTLADNDPAVSEPNVRLRYAVGGGLAGNFGSGQSFEASGHHLFRAVNVVDAHGGAEAELLPDARDRAAEDEREVTRAVTAPDYETLAVTTPGAGIVRASAAVGLHPSYACLPVPGAATIVIVPWAPRPAGGADDAAWDAPGWTFAPAPDPGARAAVCKRLDAARLVATEVFVRGPVYRHVGLVVRVEGDPLDPVGLRDAIARRLRVFLDPLRGGDGGGGWAFGDPVRPSALLREAQTAIGQQAEVVAVIVTLDGAAPANECSDVPIRAHELVTLDSVQLDLVRVIASRSGLR